MSGATHLLAGASIYSLINKKPSPTKKLVAIILAFASHFLLDAIPHFALDVIPQFDLSGLWQFIAAFLAAIFILLIAWRNRDISIVFCSIAGVLPDIRIFRTIFDIMTAAI